MLPLNRQRAGERLSLVAVLAVAGFALASCRALQGAAATPFPAPPIPIAVLAANGIVVTDASPGTVASVSETAAEQVALQQFESGSEVLNAALMNVVKDGTPEGTCWVVSINPVGVSEVQPLPTGQTTPQAGAVANYAVVGIDASTGVVVFADSGRNNSLPDLPTLTPAPST